MRAPYSSTLGRELMKILRIPVDQYGQIDKLLQLKHYGDITGLMDYRGRTQAAAYVLQKIVDNVGLSVSSRNKKGDLTCRTGIFKFLFRKFVTFESFVERSLVRCLKATVVNAV